MAVFFSKRVLTEKTSKVVKFLTEILLCKNMIFATNEHVAMLFEEAGHKCVVVWTYFPIYCFNNPEFISKTHFLYTNSGVYDGMTIINGRNLISSGFREIQETELENDSVWLVVENLCKHGSILKNNLLKSITGEITDEELINNSISETKLILEETCYNSIKLSSNMFWEKYPNVRILC